MLFFENKIAQIGDVIDRGDGAAKNMRRDLAVQHCRRDVGAIRRQLPPTASAVVHAHPRQRKMGRGESFDRLNFHRLKKQHIAQRAVAAGGGDGVVDARKFESFADEFAQF